MPPAACRSSSAARRQRRRHARAGRWTCSQRGADLDPAIYGDTEIHPKTYDILPDRDESELELIRGAHRAGHPDSASAAASRYLNVACGGTLYPGCARPIRRGPRAPAARDMASHRDKPVTPSTVTAGSLLAAHLWRDPIPVNSFHHQAVKDVAPDLIVDRAIRRWTDRSGRIAWPLIRARRAMAPRNDVRSARRAPCPLRSPDRGGRGARRPGSGASAQNRNEPGDMSPGSFC